MENLKQKLGTGIALVSGIFGSLINSGCEMTPAQNMAVGSVAAKHTAATNPSLSYKQSQDLGSIGLGLEILAQQEAMKEAAKIGKSEVNVNIYGSRPEHKSGYHIDENGWIKYPREDWQVVTKDNKPYAIIAESAYAYRLMTPDKKIYEVEKGRGGSLIGPLTPDSKKRITNHYKYPQDIPDTFTCLDFYKDKKEGLNTIHVLRNIFTLKEIKENQGVVKVVTKIKKAPLELMCEILNPEKEIIFEGERKIENLGANQIGYWIFGVGPEENVSGLRKYEVKIYENGRGDSEKYSLFFINYNQR